MSDFSLDIRDLTRASERAGKRAALGQGPGLMARLRSGEDIDDLGLVTLLHSSDVTTDELLDLARGRRPAGPPVLETFAPLYFSNECDGECKMCGMRGGNVELKRETADASMIESQLDILHRRGMRGVAVLCGEYRRGELRSRMLARAAESVRAAIARGFTHVLINVGSLEESEYAAFLGGIPRREDGRLRPHVTMCTFQETYDPRIYGKFMGITPDNPRCGFERRLANFDRAARAGMRSANPGILLGLNRDLGYELLALSRHVRHLQEQGMGVYISLPRLMKASGAENTGRVSDDDLTRIVSLLSIHFPEAKVVISTRESREIQHRLMPVIGVLTAGSPGVAPYGAEGARFEVEASQFEVSDQRPFEEILGECLDAGAVIGAFEPEASDLETST